VLVLVLLVLVLVLVRVGGNVVFLVVLFFVRRNVRPRLQPVVVVVVVVVRVRRRMVVCPAVVIQVLVVLRVLVLVVVIILVGGVGVVNGKIEPEFLFVSSTKKDQWTEARDASQPG